MVLNDSGQAQQLPAPREAAPVAGEAVPVDGEAVPAKGEPTPVSGEAAPVTGESSASCPVLGSLSARRGLLETTEAGAGDTKQVIAKVPLAEMFQYSTALRGMTQGRGTYTMEHAAYSAVPEAVALKVRKEIEAERLARNK